MKALFVGSAALIAAALGASPVIAGIAAFFHQLYVGLLPLFQLLGMA